MTSQFSNWKNSINAMDSQSQNTSLQKLHIVEKRIIRVLEIAGAVMDELSNSTGPRMEMLNTHCREFMQFIKDIQMTLREEIRSACEYRPFEKCDYSSRISNEICCKKLEYIIEQLDSMKQCISQYHDADTNNGIQAVGN
ncbi:mediator of RNA polymerase II transcription subunit 11-like [Telopea speciosissima]|uniref:mediator of RNA polymerase II transcription subunit 11-like n=1 Tax=Telopea speciosissima TaxID=54955 RepID=UPI001CC39217|nr:mediator of RNA polymerase II transcription subunit 11-like [Telopea speciosissima]